MRKILYVFGVAVLLFLLLIGYRIMVSSVNHKASNITLNKQGFKFSGMQSGIGGVGSSQSFDKQEFQYTITISKKNNIKVNKDNVSISLTDWIKQKQIESEITSITTTNDYMTIKGYIIFNTKGETKKDIISHKPFVSGVNVVTNTGKKVFVKNNIPH